MEMVNVVCSTGSKVEDRVECLPHSTDEWKSVARGILFSIPTTRK